MKNLYCKINSHGSTICTSQCTYCKNNTPEPLPGLMKNFGQHTYTIGVDNRIENGMEIFTFCVVSKEGDKVTFQQCGIVKNKFKTITDSYFKYYCNQLQEFYNNAVILHENIKENA